MTPRMGTRPLVEGGILSAITVIFALVALYIPVVGAIITLVWPLPLIVLIVRHGVKLGVMALVVSGILLTLLASPVQALSLTVGFGLMGVVLGWCLRKQVNPGKTLVLGAVASLICKAGVLLLSFTIMGINPLQQMLEAMATATHGAMDLYRGMGMREEDLAKTGTMMEQLNGLFRRIFPALFALAAVTDTYINFVVTQQVLKRLGHRIESIPHMRDWQIPRYVLLIFLMGAGLKVAGGYYQLTLVDAIGANVLVLGGSALFVQGIAVTSFYMEKFNLSRWVKVFLYVLAFTNGFVLQVVIWLGCFDLVFDYRRGRHSRPQT